jgi:hypothetical protein
MVAGEDSSHASLMGQINDEVTKGVRRVPLQGDDGPVGKPEPHERPDDRAQWDEVSGSWIEWDDAQQKWVPAPEPAGSTDAPEPAAGEVTASASADQAGDTSTSDDEAAEPPAEA